MNNNKKTKILTLSTSSYFMSLRTAPTLTTFEVGLLLLETLLQATRGSKNTTTDRYIIVATLKKIMTPLSPLPKVKIFKSAGDDAFQNA